METENTGGDAQGAVEMAALGHIEIEIDHGRLVGLVDQFERDIALIEGAMADVEMREFASANAALDVLDGVTSA